MKKTMKRAISLCLVVVMAAGLLCVSGFAAGTTKQYGSYVVIGDSIATGFGLDTYGSSSTHAEDSDMMEYYNAPRETAEVLYRDADGITWFHTDTLGHMGL